MHLGRNLGGEFVLAHRIVHGSVAINPDRVVIIANGLLVCQVAPVAAYPGRVFEHVAQAEYTAGAAVGS